MGAPVSYLQSLQDNFSDPCFGNVLNKLKLGGFDGFIANILSNFDNSNFGTIEFENGNFISDVNYAGDSQLFDAVHKRYRTRLNSKAFSKALQEFIATVIFHEVLHAYFGSQVADFGGFTRQYVC